MALTSLTNLQPIHVHSIGISTFDGSVSVGGTLTYEDVTNVDSIGIVTARDDINIITDGKKLNIGAGADLQLHHTSNHSYIDDAGTGNLRLRSGTLEIQNLASSKTSAIFSSGSGQTLNFNDSTKFVTTNTGVVITGICTATSFSGDGSNLTGIAVDSTKIETGNTKVETIDTGSDGHIKVTTEGTERFRIKSNGQVSISDDGTTDGLLTIKGDTDQVGTPSIRLLDGSDTREVSITNTSGDFVASVHGNDNAIHGHIKMFESGIFDINNGGASGSNVNRLRIATDGNVHVNMTDNGTASAKLNVEDNSSAGTNVLLISNKPSGANGKARMVFHTETSQGQGCSPYIQSVSGADAGPNASDGHNAGGFEVHTRSGGSGTDNNALRIRDDGSFEKYGANGTILMTATGSDIEFTRGGRNRLSATHANGYFDFHTGGQYTFPAMRLFATPNATTGSKVGINTDSIPVDAQMSIAAPGGIPALYTSYGMRLNPLGDSNNRISNATGVYALSKGITADNNWHTVAIGRYHAATVTIRVGDASSKRSMFINYDLTAPNYGVAHYNIIANNGQWNTGSSDFQISSSGSYDYALQVKHSSYYNSSNNSGVYMIFNVC